MLAGGRSSEHEVSLNSAASVRRGIADAGHEVLPVTVERSGGWTHDGTAIALTPGGGLLGADAVFPVLHGPFGEDGTVQGLLELANVPYVGAGVLASAVGMDKAAMKLVFAAKGLPICDYEVVLKRDWQRDERAILQQVVTRLGFPMFVKPANLGSSVGISKAKDAAGLREAMTLAGGFDRKIVIEAAVPDAREIECAVLGNDTPEDSVPGEVIPSREFYDYESKYLDEGSKSVIPADLPKKTADQVRKL